MTVLASSWHWFIVALAVYVLVSYLWLIGVDSWKTQVHHPRRSRRPRH